MNNRISKEETKIHELKVWPQYWDDLESGKKNFEVRKLDRLFGVGDTLHLKEWSPIKGYSGREMKRTVTYLMIGGQWGLAEGNCIMGISNPDAHQASAPFPDKMTFREMLTNLFDVSFLTEAELKTICDAAEMYANGVLKQASAPKWVDELREWIKEQTEQENEVLANPEKYHPNDIKQARTIFNVVTIYLCDHEGWF